jgi:hypothetical protein
MEVDLQSLFGLHVTWCAPAVLIGDPSPPPHPLALGHVYEGAIGQQRYRRHLFIPHGLKYPAGTNHERMFRLQGQIMRGCSVCRDKSWEDVPFCPWSLWRGPGRSRCQCRAPAPCWSVLPETKWYVYLGCRVKCCRNVGDSPQSSLPEKPCDAERYAAFSLVNKAAHLCWHSVAGLLHTLK